MVFNYPLNVTFDTNVLYSSHYNYSDTGRLGLLEQYVRDGKIVVYVSIIVYKEYCNYIKKAAEEITNNLNRALKENRKIADDSFIARIGYSDTLKKHVALEAQKEAMESFDDFLLRIDARIIRDENKVDLKKILDDYFQLNPPFEERKEKRYEFPDAIIAEQIKNTFDNPKQDVAIISRDNGFKAACGEASNHLFYDSLAALYDDLNKDNEQYDYALNLVTNTNKELISSSIHTALLDEDLVDVTGQETDYSGITEGNEYDESYVEDASDISFEIFSVDEITDKRTTVTLEAKAVITVSCGYDDYDNSPWDSEEKEYYYLERVSLREVHNARFAVRVEIDLNTHKLNVKLGRVLLGPSTRIDQTVL